jgi:hypothetical protein
MCNRNSVESLSKRTHCFCDRGKSLGKVGRGCECCSDDGRGADGDGFGVEGFLCGSSFRINLRMIHLTISIC